MFIEIKFGRFNSRKVRGINAKNLALGILLSLPSAECSLMISIPDDSIAGSHYVEEAKLRGGSRKTENQFEGFTILFITQRESFKCRNSY